jgi:hypothetical protein
VLSLAVTGLVAAGLVVAIGGRPPPLLSDVVEAGPSPSSTASVTALTSPAVPAGRTESLPTSASAATQAARSETVPPPGAPESPPSAGPAPIAAPAPTVAPAPTAAAGPTAASAPAGRSERNVALPPPVIPDPGRAERPAAPGAPVGAGGGVAEAPASFMKVPEWQVRDTEFFAQRPNLVEEVKAACGAHAACPTVEYFVGNKVRSNDEQCFIVTWRPSTKVEYGKTITFELARPCDQAGFPAEGSANNGTVSTGDEAVNKSSPAGAAPKARTRNEDDDDDKAKHVDVPPVADPDPGMDTEEQEDGDMQKGADEPMKGADEEDGDGPQPSPGG